MRGGVRLSAQPAVGRCPGCGEVMRVERLRCPACETAVEGRFVPLPYAALSGEQAAFLEVFLRARGNLREVERVLGLSYPTVRSRLDHVLDALGFADGAGGAGGDESPPPLDPDGRREALAALQRGDITAVEAIRRIRGGE